MPTINAAGYAAPNFPSVTPNIDAGTPYQNLQATPDAFGASVGAATNALGREFEQAGDKLANVAIQRQQLFNQVAADEQINSVETLFNKALYGDPNNPADKGYLQLKGREAMDAYPALRKQMEDIANGARSNMQNDNQRLLFDSATRRQRSIIFSEIGRHYDRQFGEWEAATAKGRLELDMGRGYTKAAEADFSGWKDQLGTILAGIDSNMRKTGAPEEAIEAAKQSATKKQATEFAKNLMDKDPTRAQQFIENNRDVLQDHTDDLLKANKVKMLKRATDDVISGRKPKVSGELVRGGASTNAVDHYTYATSIGATANEAALLTSAADAESSFVSTKTHDGGIGYGLYGHNDTRLAAMRKEFGPNPTWQQQVKFALAELRSRPEGALVNAAKTPEELTELQFQFERPKRGPTDQADRRRETTSELMRNPPKPRGAEIIDKTADAGFGQRFGPLESPQGMVVHHTAGGKSVDDVISTFKKTNFPAQFVIDRDGKIYRTLPEGYQGQHTRDSYGPLGEGKGNKNLEGVEIIADNDGDVLPVQVAAAERLIAMQAQKYGYDPKTSVYGHGELNPGHKQADEGMSTVNRVRGAKVQTVAAVDELLRNLPDRDPSELPDDQVPGLLQKMERAAKNMPANAPTELWDSVVKRLRQEGNAQWTDTQHARTLDTQKKKDIDEKWRNHYMTEMNKRLVTVDEVYANQEMTTEARDNMVRTLTVNAQPGPNPRLSENTLAEVNRRIKLDHGQEGKIYDEGAIDKIYNTDRLLTSAHYKEAITTFRDANDALNADLVHRQKQIMEAAEGKLRPYKSVGPAGEAHGDPEGPAREIRYDKFIRDQIKEFRKAGKNPADLFDPDNKAFVGKPEIVKEFSKGAPGIGNGFKDAAGAPVVYKSSKEVTDALKAGKFGPSESPAAREKAREEIRKHPEWFSTPVAPPVR